MGISAGTRIGSYEIVSPLGVGGMGEVYRARDSKLGRDVALKILPAEFALDADRLARFKREAQVLASLNHPNIAAIYGLEGPDGREGPDRPLALVLELVEGPTLAERIEGQRAEGRAQRGLSFDEVLPIARQITEALEAAHEQGIIHRDLKPANIKVRPDGTVKVLDFGLAKLAEAGNAAASGAGLALSQSPTITTPAMMTGVGMILGTAAYMSPEQAKGRPADKRSDIWAFGCVLFEMLTGQRAFHGDDVSETLASILKSEPDWAALPAGTPGAVTTTLRRCLQRDPKQRVRDVGDVRLALEGAFESPLSSHAVATTARRRLWPTIALATTSVVLAGALATLLVLATPWKKPTPAAVTRVNMTTGAEAELAVVDNYPPGGAIALSRDGRKMAFVARAGTRDRSLYVRRLDQLEAAPLPGATGAMHPFFSYDGEWIGFFADGKLKKISVNGGASVTLCDAPNDRGGAWTDDDAIVFAMQSGPLMRVPSEGGKAERLFALEPGEQSQRWPQVLPGGKAVLYSASAGPGGFGNGYIAVQSVPPGVRRVLQQGAAYGRFVSSGHVVYMHDGTLFAAPFNADTLQFAGQPVPAAVEGVAANTGTGGAEFSVSENGTLAYLTGQSAEERPIAWMVADGTTTPLRPKAANWSNPAFSPDGRRLAVDISENGGAPDVWVYDIARDALTRLTSHPTADLKPVWTPDGRRVVFASGRAQANNLYWQRADGTGDAQRLTESAFAQQPGSWDPTGKFLAFTQNNPDTSGDLMILPVDGDESSGWKPGKPRVFLQTPFPETEPMFSPDGRWIAYQSSETGRNEVYVRPFPTGDGKWQISTDGGTYPTWSRARQELFYMSPNRQQLMVVSYSTPGGSFQADKPHVWSEARLAIRPRLRSFALHSDGRRVAVATVDERSPMEKQDKVFVVFNFADELRRRAPAK